MTGPVDYGSPSRRDDVTEKPTRVRATSAPAEPGVSYRYTLQTHCGVDWNVDFDGSFWHAIAEKRAIESGDYRTLGNPSDNGEMTLTSPQRTLYKSNKGPEIVFARDGKIGRIDPCF
ncbi:MAG: hypothetical protein LC775_07200 [Acidobacteria bacterium]|nr:hypothetical protein [Acidobacteriota bacterium]